MQRIGVFVCHCGSNIAATVDVKKVVDTLFAQVENKLNEGEKVVLSGFGVFSIANSPDRIGRNPRTGVEVKIPARRNVKFRSNMDIE